MNLMNLVTKLGFEVDHKPLDTVEEKLEHIKHRLEFLAAAEIVKGIFELTERFSGFASEIATAAIGAGLTAEQLQKIQFSAEQAGSSAEEVTGAMQKLTRTLYEAQHGSKEAREAFEQAGIPPAQVMSFHTSSDALAALSDRMAQMSDPIAKQAIAMKLLGRSSGNMVEFLSGGSEEMRKVGEQAVAMGAVLSNTSVKALKEFEDSMGALWRTVKVFAATIASFFAPSIEAASKSVLKWYAANRKLILTNVKKWAESTMYAFGFLYGVVEGLTNKFLRFAEAHPVLTRVGMDLVFALVATSLAALTLGKVVNGLQGGFALLKDGVAAAKLPFELFFGAANLAKRGLILLLTNIGLAVSTAFPSLGAAIIAVGSAINATPIGWLIAGIAAVVLVGQALWTMLTTGNWEDTWLYQLYETVKKLTSGMLEKLGIDWLKDDPKAKAAADKAAAVAPSEGTAAIGRDGMVRFGGEAPEEAAGMQQLAQMFGAPAAATQMLAGPAAASMHEETTNNLNAEVNITVPAGADAGAIGKQAQVAVQSAFDTILRQTHTALKEPTAH